MSTRSLEELAEIAQRLYEQPDESELLACLQELRPFGTTKPLAAAVHTLGMLYNSLGKNEEAFRYNQWAVALHTELGNLLNAASANCNSGYNLYNLGDYPGAFEHFNQALRTQEEHGYLSGKAISLLGLANVFAATGNYPEALTRNLQALEYYERLGDRNGMAMVLNNVGCIYTTIGDHEKSLEYHRKALTINEENGDRSGIATVAGNIGVAYWKAGDFEQASEQFIKALQLNREAGEHRGVCNATGNLVTVSIDLGDWERAEAHLAELDALAVDSVEVLVQRERSRASIQIHHGELDTARDTLKGALGTSTSHANVAEAASVHKALRDLALLQNDLPGYVEHNNEFTRITEEINGKDTATKLAMQEAQRVIDQERREHEKHLAVLHATLPKHIADRVIRGETIDDHFDNVAVLFADVAGFTTHTSSMHPREVITFLEEIYKTFDAICKEHGVTKVKTIGDSYLCFSGSLAGARDDTSPSSSLGDDIVIPSASEERIARVALAMQRIEFFWPTANSNSNSQQQLQTATATESSSE